MKGPRSKHPHLACNPIGLTTTSIHRPTKLVSNPIGKKK
jgi:hypothetical protein